MSRVHLCALCALLISSSAACDLVARDGESLELGNQGLVFGSSSSFEDEFAVPGLRIQPGGAATIADAQVFGGSKFPTPTEAIGRAAAGITVLDGRLRVVQGRVQGGSVVFMEPPQVPLQVGNPGAGVLALVSEIEVLGGTLVGGAEITLPGQPQRLGAAGLLGSQIRVTIRGGTFTPGVTPGGVPEGVVPLAVELRTSTLEVSGGDFQGTFQVVNSTGVIRGGTFRVLQLGSPLLAGSGCTELRGGTFEAIRVDAAERLFIFGTGFNFPAGTRLSLGTSPVQVTGQLESGAPLNVMLAPTALPAAGTSGVITIAEPGSPGCS